MRASKHFNEYEDAALFGDSGIMVLDYDPEINRFRDGLGRIMHDIYSIINPSQFDLFRKFKSQYLVRDITGKFLVELVYPDEEEF